MQMYRITLFGLAFNYLLGVALVFRDEFPVSTVSISDKIKIAIHTNWHVKMA